MPGEKPEALVMAEGAAKLAFGTRFKKLPSAIFAKLSLPVVMVLGIIFFVYYTVVFGVVIPWMENSVPGVLNVGVLTITAGLGLVMYLCCVYCEPGRVPADWRPDTEAGGALLELKRKGGARFCKKCTRYKPPRTHHCRVCNKCVLRMDHHCVWVNNCIGHRNYKSFFLFLFYITCACLHSLGILCAHAIHSVGQESHRSQRARVASARGAAARGSVPALASGVGEERGGAVAWALAEVACLTLTFPLTIALALLFGWHCYLVVNNKTTIEHYEGVRSKLLPDSGGDEANLRLVPPLHPLHPGVEHPYSLGLWANLREILGANVSCWLAPGCSIAGDGLSFANIAEYAKWKREAERKEEELTLLGDDVA